MKKLTIDSLVKLVFVLALFTFAVSVNAQTEKSDTLDNRNVVVEREFQPVIQDVGKIISTPVLMQATVKKKSADYLSMQLPMDIENAFQPLGALKQNALNPDASPLFVDLAFGNYYNTYGNLVVPIVLKSKTELSFSALHNASFGTRKFSDTNADLYFKQDFNNLLLSANIGFGHNFWNYYGRAFSLLMDTLPLPAVPGDLSVATFKGELKFRSKATGMDKIAYTGDFKYAHTALSNSIVENRFEFETDVNFGLKKQNGRPFGAVIAVDYFDYKQDFNQMADTVNSLFAFTLSPYWKFQNENLDLKLGFNMQMSGRDSSELYFSPQILLSYKPFSRFASFYASIDGGVDNYGLKEIFAANPYVLDGKLLEDSYVPVRTVLGSLLNPIDGLQLNLSADYSYRLNEYYFVNNKTASFENRFDVIYQNVSSSFIHFDADYRFKNNLFLNFKTNYKFWWNLDESNRPWMKPAFTSNLNLKYVLDVNWSFGGELHYESSRYAKFDLQELELASIVDVNLQAEYRFNDSFNSYIKLNNLLNRHNQYIVGYDTQGLNFMLGASYNL